MVLSDRTIREELAKGRIVIKPRPDESCIQPASVDIHLGHEIRVFRPWQYPHAIDLQKPLDGLTESVEIEKGHFFSLQPGQFVLASTLEYIAIPDDLMARLEGKSSLGRIGLLIHSTAGYVDPGWKGQLTLELYNVCSLPILLYPEMKISQISFHRLTSAAERPYGSPQLRSKYQHQTGPTPTRMYQEFPQGTLVSLATVEPKSKAKHLSGDSNALRKWLKESRFHGNVASFAEALQVPVKTAEDWVYRGARPSLKNRAKLFSLTGLPQFKTDGLEEQHRLSLRSE